MAAELDRAARMIAALLTDIQDRDARLARLTPAPEVRAAMVARSSGMRPVLADINGRLLVIVKPAGGFDDPDVAYGRIAHTYGGEGEALP